MGRYYQGVKTHFLCQFAWCIARLVAPELKTGTTNICFQILKLSGASFEKNIVAINFALNAI